MSCRRANWARCLALPTALLLLAGCGLFGDKGRLRNHSNDYLLASSTEPLVLPADFDSATIEDIYYVPPLTSGVNSTEAFEVARPQPLVAGDFDNLVTIQALGQEQWVLVRLLPGQVWPRVRDFLIQRRVGVGFENGDQGVIQSPWIQSRQAAFDELYRFTLTQGLQRNTCEIRITQAQSKAGADGSRRAQHLSAGQDWPQRSDDARRERLMVQQFANYLSGRVDVNAPVSLMAQGISTSTRLYMAPGDDPLIRVNLAQQRAWASLGLALDKAGFDVLQANSASGTYQVRAPVMSDGSGKKKKSVFSVFKPSTYRGEEVERKTYRVRLENAPQSDWMQIRMLPDTSADSETISTDMQQQLLTQVKAFLT